MTVLPRRVMRWEDVNTKWRGLTIRDKVEGERVIS